MHQAKTLKQKIKARVVRTKKTDVFLPRDFSDLSGEDQVLRALRSLVRDGSLLRLGYGVYARAQRSRITGRPMVSSANGFHGAALQALNKLGVPWEQSESANAYDEGRSTQIPVNPTVKVKARFNRRLSDGRTELRVER
ncbi:conjugal transfer protein [Brucella intermedia]|uniref:conjugal transfer protein n=1 Tax=Brucella intermedia TaxID=94625 RepID=UPI002362EE15|nr:conjugal transfer protein [Brucella intermedia]